MTIIDSDLDLDTESLEHFTTDAFWAVALEGAPGASLSLDRCIDWLLDLHQATDHVQLKALVADVLDDLRSLGCGPRGFAGLDLDDVVLGALASVEAAFAIVERR